MRGLLTQVPAIKTHLRMTLRIARHSARTLWPVLVGCCVVACLLTLLQCMMLVANVAVQARLSVELTGVRVPSSAPCLGDFVAYALFGVAQPEPAAGIVSAVQQLKVSFGWLVLVLLPLVPSLLGAAAEKPCLAELVACSSRRDFWLGQALYSVASCALVWALVCCTWLMATAWVGGELQMVASDWFPEVMSVSPEGLPAPPYELEAFLAVSLAVSCALALVQASVSVVFGRTVSLLLTVACLVGAFFSMAPALLGNYLMAARSSVFVASYPVEVQNGFLQPGLDAVAGIVTAVACAAAALVAGGVVVQRKDYLGGGRG